MRNYLNLLEDILETGCQRGDRTGTGTRSVFGRQLRFDLSKGFPLVTTKKVHIPSVVHELLWFIKGDTNVKYLQENGVKIWNEWATQEGDLGPIYGNQWREWKSPKGKVIDQLADVVEQIKKNPYSRRHIVSAWNPADLPDETLSPQENVEAGQMALAPCHTLFQFYVANNKLSLQLYQRSCDVFLGLPFNIASYALLTHMVAQQCDLEVGDFVWSGGDTHLYSNHVEQAMTQLKREPLAEPKLIIKRKAKDLFDYTADDFEFENYEHHAPIRAPISI